MSGASSNAFETKRVSAKREFANESRPYDELKRFSGTHQTTVIRGAV